MPAQVRYAIVYKKDFILKKMLALTVITLFALVACSDEHADLRKMTVQDYLDNKPLMSEVLDQCGNDEIIDDEICSTVREAVNNNFDIFG